MPKPAFLLSALLILASAPCVLPCAAMAADDTRPTLERVVLIARHGIRSPTRPITDLDARTHRTWPAWPVPPGEISAHGRDNLQLMGAALGQHYRQEGLLPQQGCTPMMINVWADSAAHRTMESGAIMGHAMAPDCPVAIASLPAGTHDPVFNSLPDPVSPTLQAAIMTDLRTAIAHDHATRPADVDRALGVLQTVIGPDGCVAGGPCFTAPDSAAWQKNAPHLTGGLQDGAEMAEDMLLEYAQGLPATAIVWGHDTPRRIIDAVTPAHNHTSRLLRRMPVFAFARGHVLARMITNLVSAKAATLPDGNPVTATTRMVVFAGHDTTLDMLAAIFGLDWSFPDLPDPTGPDTTLGFETWRMPDGTRRVRAVIFHQGLEALRNGQAITARPDILPMTACHAGQDGRCSLDDFSRIFNARLDATCIQ